MKSVKDALRAKALAHQPFVDLVGGAAVAATRFVQRRPASLPELPCVTFFMVFGSDDVELPRADEEYQIDCWGRTSDEADAIAEVLDVLFHPTGTRGTLALSGRRFGEMFHVAPRIEVPDEDPDVRHVAIRIRVISYAA